MAIQDGNEQDMMKLWILVVDLSDVITRVKAQAAGLNAQTQMLKVSFIVYLLCDFKVHGWLVHVQ